MKTYLLKDQNRTIAAIQAATSKGLTEQIILAASEHYTEQYELLKIPSIEAVDDGKCRIIKGRFGSVQIWFTIEPVVLYSEG